MEAGLSEGTASRRWGRSVPYLAAVEQGRAAVGVLSLRALCAVYETTLTRLVRLFDEES